LTSGWNQSFLISPLLKKAQNIGLGFFVEKIRSSNHHAAIGHNGLTGDVLASGAGQENRNTANVIWLANSAQGRFIFDHARFHGVVCQGLGKGRSNEAWCDAIDAYVVGAPLIFWFAMPPATPTMAPQRA